ncbi:hypothetical protein WS84_07270 [Burkholderia anthina]|nr:hypothetical protein WS84_07270 [Burkholderia anthina]KVH14160.1 hypothetical protein WS85_06155 [Burkholderia anthina]KVN53143.1 hypothetical protein WT13_32170 [Burkholderia anthina]KVX32304.1 hypothetical protein WT32_20255 [Burkholderia anthina]
MLILMAPYAAMSSRSHDTTKTGPQISYPQGGIVTKVELGQPQALASAHSRLVSRSEPFDT